MGRRGVEWGYIGRRVGRRGVGWEEEGWGGKERGRRGRGLVFNLISSLHSLLSVMFQTSQNYCLQQKIDH
jgi:hypothetical protein